MIRFPRRALVLVSLSVGLLAAAPARAASMQKVNQSDWWSGVTGLPSYVNMYIYVPDKLATKPPIVVAPHHCRGTASSTYSEMSSLVSIANTNGFIMIFPEATGENCWDAGSTRSLKHGGGGDTGAVVQMVKYTLAKYGGDANRVYSVGGSSGGIMTEALLGVYPDVFMAGVSLMGVPCGCWAQGYNDVTGNGNTAQWSGSCAGGSVMKTGQQWGDLVRSYFPGYTGHRPRLQHWHGTADTTLNYKNMAEDVKEWTNLLGLSETPTRDRHAQERHHPPVLEELVASRCTRRFHWRASGTRCRSTETRSPLTSASIRRAGRIPRPPPVRARCRARARAVRAAARVRELAVAAVPVARRARAVAAGRARAAPLAGATAASTPLPTAAAARRTAAVQGAERRAAREPAAARRARAGAWPPALAVRSAALAAAQPAAAAPPAPPGPAIRRARRATAQPADPAAPLRERPVPQAAPARRARARAKIRAAAAAARSPFSRQAALPPRSCWPSHR